MFDLLVSVPIATIFSPFAVVVALLIKLGGKGPVLYRARRVGKNGDEFTMYKFRTMVTDAESIGGASTSARDPRITPVGVWLRRWKLDEFPQLFNVIRGDMSLVGPRPTLDWDVERYSTDERRLLSVKPGMTDWASIRFRDEGEILKDEPDPDEAYDRLIRPEKIRLGLSYVHNASLREDLAILVATARAVVGHDPDARRNVEGTGESPAFFKITEDWSTPANEQQWGLARQRYSLAATLGRGKDLVEVGCGTGYGLSQVARFTKSAVGVDIDERNVSVARERAPHCVFIRGDASDLPFANGTIDCLIGLEMFYYLPNQRAFVTEANRALRPGGTLLLSMPNPYRPAFHPSPFSTSYPSTVELPAILDEAGFDVQMYGTSRVVGSSASKEIVRRVLVRMHLIPSTIEGRARLKKVVFRRMRPLESIDVDPELGFADLTPLQTGAPSADFAITVCVATRR